MSDRDDRVTVIAPGVDMSPGGVFPTTTLPSIAGGREFSVEDFRGEKLMLHLFASW